MENRIDMLRRVASYAPEQRESRLRSLRKEWPADRALAEPLLRALGFRTRREIEEERRVLELLAEREPR